jgi:hypothetical protein
MDEAGLLLTKCSHIGSTNFDETTGITYDHFPALGLFLNSSFGVTSCNHEDVSVIVDGVGATLGPANGNLPKIRMHVCIDNGITHAYAHS